MAVRKRIKVVKKEDPKIKDIEAAKASGQGLFGKLKNRKVFIPLAVIIIAGILFYFKGLFVAAIVNGQPISRLSIIQELEKRSGKQALSSLVTQALILQEAEKKNVVVDQQELTAMIKKLEEDLKKQGQNLDQALSVQGMTKKDLEGQFRLKRLVEKMLEKDIRVTDKEVNNFIESNKASIPQDAKMEEVKANAKEQLSQQKLSEKVQAWLGKLEKDAKILRFVNY